MDELSRMASDVSQLTRRVDDLSGRLVVVEVKSTNFDEKLDRIDSNVERMASKLEKRDFWIFSFVFGTIILAFLKFALDGGLVTAAKALGG